MHRKMHAYPAIFMDDVLALNLCKIVKDSRKDACYQFRLCCLQRKILSPTHDVCQAQFSHPQLWKVEASGDREIMGPCDESE